MGASFHQEAAVEPLLNFRNKLEIPWASTIREANRWNANMSFYSRVLEYAVGEGYELFDFGRSTVDSGTFNFKKQWGATPRQLYWNYWLRDPRSPPILNPSNPRYAVPITIWQHLPLAVAKIIGPHIIKHIP